MPILNPDHVLTPEQILYAIQTFGLSIRQIPMVTHLTPNVHGGYWMCQEVKHTSSMVVWNKKTHSLAPTLGGSVKMHWDMRLKEGEV